MFVRASSAAPARAGLLIAETRLSEPAYSKAGFYENIPQSRQYRGLDFDAYQKDPSLYLVTTVQPGALAGESGQVSAPAIRRMNGRESRQNQRYLASREHRPKPTR